MGACSAKVNDFSPDFILRRYHTKNKAQAKALLSFMGVLDIDWKFVDRMWVQLMDRLSSKPLTHLDFLL